MGEGDGLGRCEGSAELHSRCHRAGPRKDDRFQAKLGLTSDFSIPPNVDGEPTPECRRGTLSPELYRRGGRSVNCAASSNDREKEKRMGTLAAIQIVATATLLVAHLAIVVRNRFAQRV